MKGINLSDIQSRKVRILGIAPYDGMRVMMEQLASLRDDIELEVFVGDLDQGVSIALQNVQSNYDILVSRGGTAKMLEQESSLPVVEVEISIFDTLRAIKQCENFEQPFAIVGFPNITANARILCELMHYGIDIHTIHNHREASEVLYHLQASGISMVLCDMVTYTEARNLGMNAVLIASGMESVSAAFDQAVSLHKTFQRMIMQDRFYQDILRESDQKILVMKENGEIIFTTIAGELLSKTVSLLTPEIPAVIKKRETKFFKNIDQTLYSCVCKSFAFADSRYATFYLDINSVPIISGKYGIQYSSQKEIQDVFFNNIYNVTNIDTARLNEVSSPVVLIGEPGTGKEQAARMIYSRSRLSRHPLITVTCELLNERSWNFLINHYNSPFNDNENTIFLKNVTALSNERFQQLLSTMIDTSLCKRNRVIFSCDVRPGQPIPPEITRLTNLVSCILYSLKPARERAEDIPALCTLYLNSLNLSMPHQIIGLEPEALRLLQSYSWPYNYTQLKRVLNELAIVTKTPYIRGEDVSRLLQNEQEFAMPRQERPQAAEEDSAGFHSLDLSRSLNEITLDVVRLVLEDNDGNQSAAAKQLKIGRSTLWRYLK